jgi:hypothetical protein
MSTSMGPRRPSASCVKVGPSSKRIRSGYRRS